MNDENDLSIEGFVTLHIPCRYSYLRIVRQSVADLCVHANLSEFKAAELEMAVDEACAAIIQNAASRPGGKQDPRKQGLRVNLIRKPNSLSVELYDHGPPLDFKNEVEPNDFAENPIGDGFGIYVIKRFVDSFTYTPNTHMGNHLHLVKNF